MNQKSKDIFGEVQTVILCETVREEENNKASFLGVYGPLGEVDIQLMETGKPLAKLTVVIFFGMNQAVGKTNLGLQFIAPDGSDYIPLQKMPFDVTELKRKRIVFGIERPLFEMDGDYILKIFADNQEIYAKSFEVKHNPTS